HFFQGAGNVVSPVQDSDIAQSYTLSGKVLDAVSHPMGSCLIGAGVVVDHRYPLRQHSQQVFFDPVAVFTDQGIGRRQDLGGRTVIVQHHDGADAGELLIEFQQIAHTGPPPGVDGLVRIAHDEEIAVVSAQNLHQPVLQLIDILVL